jgi:Tol biopolymer transport system component
MQKARIAMAVAAVLTIFGCSGGSGLFRGLLFYDTTLGPNLLHRIQANGGTSVDVANTSDAFLGSMTQDGDVVTSKGANGNINIIIGGIATELTNTADDDFRPSVNPAGTKIAFIRRSGGNDEIYTMNINGSNVTNVSNDAASDYFPAINLAGTKVVFQSDRDGNNEIYVVNTDGSGLVRLTNNAADDTTPCFSPDGTQIYFCSDRVGGLYQIYRMDADGSNVVQITTGVGDKFHPSLNVNGNRIFYYVSGGGGTDGLYSANITGSGAVLVPGVPTTASKTNGSWVY